MVKIFFNFCGLLRKHELYKFESGFMKLVASLSLQGMTLLSSFLNKHLHSELQSGVVHVVMKIFLNL